MLLQDLHQPNSGPQDPDDPFAQDEGWRPGGGTDLDDIQSAEGIDRDSRGGGVPASKERQVGSNAASGRYQGHNGDRFGSKHGNSESPNFADAGSLGQKEKNAGENLYHAGPDTHDNMKKSRFGWLNKKRAGAAGGVAGATLGGGMLLLVMLTGPLEFVHLAEILHNAHFSSEEEAGDMELGKMFRYVRYARNGGSVAETRVGVLGSTYNKQILAELSDIGIAPTYGDFDVYSGFTVDTEHKSSPYAGMTPEEAADAFKQKTGIRPDINGKKLTVNANKAFSNKSFVKAMVNEMDVDKVGAALRAFNLARYYGASFHVLRPLDEWANKKLGLNEIDPFLKDKFSKIFKGQGDGITVQVDGSTATTGEDDKGNPISASDSDKATATAAAASTDTSESVLKGLATGKTAGIAGGVAAISGVVCGLKAVNDNVAAIRYAKIVIPLINMGIAAISIGYQIKSGHDVDPAETQYLSKNFSKVDQATGQTQGWEMAKSIRAETGQSGGIDSLAKNGIKAFIASSNIAWLAWTESSAIGALCSPASQVATNVVSIGIGLLSGELVSTVVGLVAGGLLTGPILSEAATLLAGDAINTVVGATPGPQWGSEVDYGAAMAANANAVSMGGTALTPAQATAATAEAQQDQTGQFKSENFLARMFDVEDYRSLTSRVADSLSTSALGNLNSMISSVVGAGSSALSLPFNLYSSTVHADPQPYDYPFPIYGFSAEDQNNPAVQDPFANAETVAKLLDSDGQNGTPDYIKKAQDCFGVQIGKDGDGKWDVVPSTGLDIYDTKTYHPEDCSSDTQTASGQNKSGVTLASKTTGGNVTTASAASTEDLNWLRVRFFIFDTSVMEGYTCAEFNDAQSCANDGIAVSGASNNADAVGSDPVTLANQILTSSKIKLSSSAKADLQATAQSQDVTPGPTSTTPGTAGVCTSRDPVSIDVTLLQAIVTLAQSYSFTIGDLVSGHACDAGRHPLGRAADITELNGTPINWSTGNSTSDRTFASAAANVLANLLPDGNFVSGEPLDMGGVGVCTQDDIAPRVDDINYFTGSCDRLDIDTGVDL